MKITIDERYCTGCGICIEVCPKNIFKASDMRSQQGYLMPEIKNEKHCIECNLCEKLCPEMCINVVSEEVSQE